MKNSNALIFLNQKMGTVKPIILTNNKKTFVRHGGQKETATLDRHAYLETSPKPVIDTESLNLIQVLQLHKAIDHTNSATGSAVLLRSLVQPETDLDYIQSKQAALKEIATNDRLRGALTDCVREFTDGENALYKFFNKGINALFPYHDIKTAQKSAANITKISAALPGAESAYLRSLISQLKTQAGSSIDQMMSGSVFKTFQGVTSGDLVGILTPKLKFIPRRLTKWLLAGPCVAAAPLIVDKLGITPSLSPTLTGLGLVWTGVALLYGLFMKPIKDTEKFIEPLRKKCINDPGFGRAIDTMGRVDELLSCHSFACDLPHAVILPTVTDKTHHSFETTGLKNPVLATGKKEFMPNSVQMSRAKLTFISGPNSGGKTTICKSIVHNQLLAQMGSYVLADKAVINITDMIRYQAPQFDGLQDDEGRFGTELARTRDIFFKTGPKSLVILDELAEGTTYEEQLEESFGILSDFHTIGNNTILVTHNHSVVDRFMAEKKGQCFQVEFNGDDPTYRIVPGISRVSHAGRIAKKIGFSKSDRHRYMEEKGYV